MDCVLGGTVVNKWEQVNSLLADARHYANDIKEELTLTQQRLSAAEARIKELEAELVKYTQQLATGDTQMSTHKYNLSSNMQHRVAFDMMVENTLTDAQRDYSGEPVNPDWTLYLDLEELDVDNEAEATARIEAIWPKQ
jgi:chromosome segregation ATPase